MLVGAAETPERRAVLGDVVIFTTGAVCAALAAVVADIAPVGRLIACAAAVVFAVAVITAVGRWRRAASSASPALLEVLTVELERSRRHGRRFVLLRSYPEGSITPQDHVAALLPRLRTIDDAWTDGRALYVLLPESNRVVAEALVRRLALDAPGTLPRHATATAVFPDDGLTSGALLAALDAGDRATLTGAAPEIETIEVSLLEAEVRPSTAS